MQLPLIEYLVLKYFLCIFDVLDNNPVRQLFLVQFYKGGNSILASGQLKTREC